jgi:catechol 2,3-dioxygenase-like lactoylglutathione lyase family enzyme
MLDHITLPVRDLERARAFYLAALAPLGIGIVMEATPEQTGGAGYAGFGADGKAFFWIGGQNPTGKTHVAFAAKDRASVDAFYAAAIAAGGRDNGAPGLRPHYHPDYYGAFVLDADGYNIEAVCRLPA